MIKKGIKKTKKSAEKMLLLKKTVVVSSCHIIIHVRTSSPTVYTIYSTVTKYYDSCVLTSNKKQPTVPHTTEDFYESLDSVGHCTLFVVVFSLCLTYLLLLSLLIKNSATYSISTKPFFLLFWFLLFFWLLLLSFLPLYTTILT